MYSYRIIPADYKWCPDGDWPCIACIELKRDTIPVTSEWTAEEMKALAEIIKDEWDEIWNGFFRFCTDTTKTYRNIFTTFHEYLSDLLSLVPLKGLTVEEIKKLNEVKR